MLHMWPCAVFPYELFHHGRAVTVDPVNVLRLLTFIASSSPVRKRAADVITTVRLMYAMAAYWYSAAVSGGTQASTRKRG